MVLAVVWGSRRRWSGGEIFDCSAWLRHCGWTVADRTAPRFYDQMDLARRRPRLSGFSSEFSMECSGSLGLCATHAQHQGRRPRRGSFSRGVLRPTGSHHSAALSAYLDHRRTGLSLLRPAETFPVPRLVLSNCVHSIRRSQGQELLRRTNLSGLSGGWSSSDRELYCTVAASMAEARARSADSRGRRLACASCHAGSPRSAF